MCAASIRAPLVAMPRALSRFAGLLDKLLGLVPKAAAPAPYLESTMGLLDQAHSFAQGASNGVAGSLTGPVDGLAWLLRKAGVPVPQAPLGGSDWMRNVGLMQVPKERLAGLLGEGLGSALPTVMAGRAPEIAGGLLRMQDNAMAPRTLNPQTGAVKVADYAGHHKPMTRAGGASGLEDLTGAFGDDIYSKNALQFFGSGDAREARVMKTLQSLRGKPDAMVTVYRGIPEGAAGKINPGDWVSLSPEYAADYGRVISQQVPASHITGNADSLLEFGYHPPK